MMPYSLPKQEPGKEPESVITARPLIGGILLCVIGIFIIPYLINATTVFPPRNWKLELSNAQHALQENPSQDQHFFNLTFAILPAIECKQHHLAKEYANELISLAENYVEDPDYGKALHLSHIVLGRLALVNGDTAAACKELSAAGQYISLLPGDGPGPNMSLARELLRIGQQPAVQSYLEECRRAWPKEDAKFQRWRFMIKIHLPPDFGINQYY